MIEIHEAKEADAAGLLAIYAPYVEHTAITFEYEVPTLEEFTERIRQTKTKYPYLVAKQDGKVLGYACGTGKSVERTGIFEYERLYRLCAEGGRIPDEQ